MKIGLVALASLCLVACIDVQKGNAREKGASSPSPHAEASMPSGGSLGPPSQAASDQGMEVPIDTAAFHFSPFQQYIRWMPDMSNYILFDGVFVGDVTGDGLDDIVARSNQNLITVIAQKGDGTLAEPMLFPFGADSYANYEKTTVLADFNNDGVKDVAAIVPARTEWGSIEPGGLALLLSDGRGGLTYRLARPPDEWNRYQERVHAEANALDYDGDGYLDMVAGIRYTVTDDVCGAFPNPCPSEVYLQVFFGDESQPLARMELFPTGIQSPLKEFRLLDMNGDGLRDLIFITQPNDYSTVERGSIFAMYQLRGGGWSAARDLMPGPVSIYQGKGVLFADFNADGRPDVLQLSQSDGWGPELRFQLSNGVFSVPQYLGTHNGGAHPETAIAEDFDGNGMPDLIQRQIWFRGGFIGDLGLSFYPNDSGVPEYQSFTSMFEYSNFDDNPYYFSSGDLNGDGCKDLVIAGTYHGILIAYGLNCVTAARQTGGKLPPRRRK